MAVIIKFKSVLLCFLAAVTITALSVTAYYSGAYAVYFGATPRALPIYSVEREDKVVSISFDCAWGTEHTDAILDAMRMSNVNCTFFMVEFWRKNIPSTSKKSTRRGTKSARIPPRTAICLSSTPRKSG